MKLPTLLLLGGLAALGGCSSATPPAAAPTLTSAALAPLLDAHVAIINEPDAARRRERMSGVYRSSVAFHDPGPTVIGFDAVSAAYGKLHERYPGALFERGAEILERDGLVRMGWTLGRPGEPPLHHGEDIMRIEDGRIAAIWVFIAAEPTTVAELAGIEHAGVTVPNLAAATTFFHDVMGCERVTSMGAFKASDDWMTVHLGVDARTEVAGIAMLRCGHGANLELLEYVDHGAPHRPIGNSDPGAAHLSFYTPNMKAALARLAQHGIQTMGEPFTKTSGDTAGETFVYFRTPWGLQLELTSAPNGKAYEKTAKGTRLWSPLTPAD